MSERITTNTQKGQKDINKPHQLSTALYIRLSREDGDKGESVSIANQRLLLEDFVNSRDDYAYFRPISTMAIPGQISNGRILCG